MTSRANLSIILVENHGVRSVCASIADKSCGTRSTSWDVHVAKGSFGAGKTLVRHAWDVEVFNVVSRAAKHLHLSGPVTHILHVALGHHAGTQRAVVVWLAWLRHELGLVVAEVTAWTELWDGSVTETHLTRVTLDRVSIGFRTPVTNRAVEAVVLEHSSFKVNKRSSSTSAWFVRAKRAEVTLGAYFAGMDHSFVLAVVAFIALQAVIEVNFELLWIVCSSRAQVLVLLVDF